MTIRKITNKDYLLFRKLRIEALKNNPESFISSLAEEIEFSNDDWKNKINDGNWFGFFDNDVLAGIINIKIYSKIKISHIAEISGMYVSSSYRGKNIATKLLNFVEKFALDYNILQLHLGCNAENLSAINLYQKNGFKIFAKLPDYSNVGNKFCDDLIMIKILN